MKRIRKWVLVIFCMLGVTGLAFFIAMSLSTQQRRDHALKNYQKPAILQRYELPVERAASLLAEPDPETVAPSNAETIPADQYAQANYALYEQLFAQISQTWVAVDDIRWYMRHKFTEETWEQLAALARDHPELLEAIRVAAQRGAPLRDIDLPMFYYGQRHRSFCEPLGQCALLLAADLRNQVASGNFSRALENVEAAILLSNTLAKEPAADTYDTSLELYAIISQAYQEQLSEGLLSTEQNAAVLKLLNESRHRQAAFDVIQADQYMAVKFLEDLNALSTHDFMLRYAGGDSEELGTNIAWWFMGSAAVQPVVNQNIAHIVEQAARFESFEPMSLPEILDEHDTFFQQWAQSTPVLDGFAMRAIHTGYFLTTEQARHEAQLDLMRLGIAIEQYRALHGAYPVTLDVLEPILGTAIPTDPFNGLPFQYTPQADGFLLHNLGRDRIPSRNTGSGWNNDLVWREGDAEKTAPNKSSAVVVKNVERVQQSPS